MFLWLKLFSSFELFTQSSASKSIPLLGLDLALSWTMLLSLVVFTALALFLCSFFFLRASASALCLEIYQLEFAEWPPPLFAHFPTTWAQIFLFSLLKPVSLHWWCSILWGPPITHFGTWYLHFSIRSWPRSEQVIHIKLGPNFECFFITFMTPLNCNHNAHSFLASFLLLTVITIAEFYLLLNFCCYFKQFSRYKPTW